MRGLPSRRTSLSHGAGRPRGGPARLLRPCRCGPGTRSGGSATDARDRISDLIGPHIEAQLGGEVRESPNGLLLVARWAVLLHEGAEDLDIIHAGEPVLARRATATIGRP